MFYGKDKKVLLVADIVNQFDMNDKSIITIMNQHDEVLFEDRVDYLQYTSEGEMHEFCKLRVEGLDVGSYTLIIFVKEDGK